MSRARGRMISVDIAVSEKIAKLSPKALSLFCLLLPHLSSYGKMPAGTGHIKDTVCPLIPWLTQNNIPALLKEISRHTSLKYFKDAKGLPYLHSLSWREHQDLRADRMGDDRLPDYSGKPQENSRSSPGVVPPEVEVEVEDKGKVEDAELDSSLSPVSIEPNFFEINPEVQKFLQASSYFKSLAEPTKANMAFFDSALGMEEQHPGFDILKAMAEADLYVSKRPQKYRFAQAALNGNARPSAARSFLGNWFQNAVKFMEG